MGSPSRFTTFTITLGCNVGGLKRLDKSRREQWRDVVGLVIDDMPTYHDAMLVELVGDHSQWMYLTRLPVVWSQGEIRSAKRKGDSRGFREQFPRGVHVASYRYNRSDFEDMMRRMVHTKKELAHDRS